MSHFFISYKREDKDFVDELEQRISDAKLLPWRDVRTPVGELWKNQIDLALDAAYALILVVTPEALASEYVAYEWAYAMGQHKKIVPIILRDVDEKHPKLADLQYLDYKNSDFWEKLIERLIEIRKQLDKGEIPEAVLLAERDLNSPNPDERKRGIQALKTYQHPATFEALVRAIDHDYPDVRFMAGLKLAEKTNYSDERCIQPLREALFFLCGFQDKETLEKLDISCNLPESRASQK